MIRVSWVAILISIFDCIQEEVCVKGIEIGEKQVLGRTLNLFSYLTKLLRPATVVLVQSNNWNGIGRD
jgi:hypothetical protein